MVGYCIHGHYAVESKLAKKTYVSRSPIEGPSLNPSVPFFYRDVEHRVGPHVGPHDAERRQSLGQLYA